MNRDRHHRGLHLIQHCLEGLLDETAAWVGTSASTYRSSLWEAKDAVKRATTQIDRLIQEAK